MHINDELTLLVHDIALGIRTQMETTGMQTLTAEDAAALILSFSLKEAVAWLRMTLDWNADQRLNLSLILLQQYQSLVGLKEQ